MDNTILLENTISRIKHEFEDNDYLDDKMFVSETTVQANDIEEETITRDSKFKENGAFSLDYIKEEIPSLKVDNTISDFVKIENEIRIKNDNGVLFCDHCQAYYEDFCTICGMLVHILNGNTSNNTHNNVNAGIPKDIVEIRESSGHFGIFAMKCIPKNVRFGPVSGVSLSERSWKLKRGKIVVSEVKSEFLNWMQYVNPAKDIFERNLFTFQWDDNLYYRSTREINAGEELLVYFGEEFEDSLNKDDEVNFVPVTENNAENVFACTFCCLGFNARLHLTKHKTVCLKEGRFSIKEITQCSFCKIYMDKKEFTHYHMVYCCEKNYRKGIPLVQDDTKVEIRKPKTQGSQTHNCPQCNYKTIYKVEMNSHVNKHYEVKVHRCGICCKRFKTKGSLKLHVENAHVTDEGGEDRYCSASDFGKGGLQAKHIRSRVHPPHDADKPFKCSKCDFRTKWKHYMKDHVKVKHLKEFNYKCKTCKFKTKHKRNLIAHTNTRHLKEYKYNCAMCEYKTNQRTLLSIHVKRKHLKEYDYKCQSCDYKTNWKLRLDFHVKAIHLKVFSYKCTKCEYKTNSKSYLERHVKTKHLKEFDYECEICGYKTNDKHYLEYHTKTIHLKEFNYNCELCQYRANKKSRLESHIKTKHLKEFNHACDACAFKTNCRSHLRVHTKTYHFKEFNYKCEMCAYKTNRKISLEIHVKTKHLKEFAYKCEACGFRTNWKSDLERHTKTKHLKEFNYKCEMCEYKAKWKSSLESHTNNKHLKEFKYKCEMCEYKTNNKSHLKTHARTEH